MLDENGFIKIPEAGDIHPAFRPAVNHVVDMLTGRLGRVIHSLYLYGSVARGNAVAGQSDLDICLLLYQKAGAREARMLRAIASETERQQRAITKVDFDVGTLAEALNPDNLHRWGCFLRDYVTASGAAGRPAAERKERIFYLTNEDLIFNKNITRPLYIKNIIFYRFVCFTF